MRTFKIQITEKLMKTVEVVANSLQDAVITVKSKYKNDEIILDYSNFRDVTFESIDFETEYKNLVDELIDYIYEKEKITLKKTGDNNEINNNIFHKLEKLKELNTH